MWLVYLTDFSPQILLLDIGGNGVGKIASLFNQICCAMFAGVHASDDGADVACPVSLIDWFLSFYKAAQQGPVQPLEGICTAGEVLFVPRGWWHMALNVEVKCCAVFCCAVLGTMCCAVLGTMCCAKLHHVLC